METDCSALTMSLKEVRLWDMEISVRCTESLAAEWYSCEAGVLSPIFILKGDMTTSGYIIHPVAGRTIKVDTIEELLEQVTAILASV